MPSALDRVFLETTKIVMDKWGKVASRSIMAKNNRGNGQAPGISQPLIIGLVISIAFAAFMAGWFVLTVSSVSDVEVSNPAEVGAPAPIRPPRL
jgi:hypothetical protein